MSAWYILNKLGFYPLCPGNPNYSIGLPGFEKVEIRLKDNKVFTIIAENFSEDNPYVQSVFLGDKKLTKPYISHEEIVSGNTLRFEMGPEKTVFWE